MHKTIAFSLAGALTLGLAGYTAHTLTRERGPDDAAAAKAKANSTAARAPVRAMSGSDLQGPTIAQIRERARQRVRNTEDDRPAPPPVYTRSGATTRFEALMEQLEAMADRGEALANEEKDKIYRDANDAFTALSSQLDPKSDPNDAAQLENAHMMLVENLARLEIEPKTIREGPGHERKHVRRRVTRHKRRW